MAENSKIEWTHHTFNPWRGCTKVAEGCKFCYADALSKQNPGTLGIWGDNGTRVVASEKMWREPIKWNAQAEKLGERHRVFCASLADVFEDWQKQVVDSHGKRLFVHPSGGRWESQPNQPSSEWVQVTMNDVRRRLFKLIDATPHLDWLLLTKRPENIRRMWSHVSQETWNSRYNTPLQGTHHRTNVWLGTSVATQDDADKNIPELLKCRDLSPCLFVSYEPAIGPVNFTLRGIEGWDEDWRYNTLSGREFYSPRGDSDSRSPRIDWVIVGGESGPNARPFNVDWARSAIRQCDYAGVKCFLKQLGSKPFYYMPLKLKHHKGGDMSEWAEDLRVQEFPEVTIA